MNTSNLIEVQSSYGSAYVDRCGIVQHVEADEGVWLFDIESFDLVECRDFWKDTFFLKEYDCLDLGYTEKNGTIWLAEEEYRRRD